ncbi:MAG: toll/interleukin-1 receptor domain-containing protein [Sedimenticola sp.]
MAIEKYRLRSSAPSLIQSSARSVAHAKQLGYSTAFLCHSHKDEPLVNGLVNLLQQNGWRVYVDWKDLTMPSSPNRETAAKIKSRIEATNYFLFLATSNSITSRWCPWEIGYADGKKDIEKIIVIPTRERMTTHGNEYIDLYRRIDLARDGKLAVFSPGQNKGAYVSSLR